MAQQVLVFLCCDYVSHHDEVSPGYVPLPPLAEVCTRICLPFLAVPSGLSKLHSNSPAETYSFSPLVSLGTLAPMALPHSSVVLHVSHSLK